MVMVHHGHGTSWSWYIMVMVRTNVAVLTTAYHIDTSELPLFVMLDVETVDVDGTMHFIYLHKYNTKFDRLFI